MLHAMGREFGATTGRARRCGWFDAVATRYARIVNGIDELAITNLDGLDTLKEIRICVAYDYRGKRIHFRRTTRGTSPLPADLPQFPGWRKPTSAIRHFKKMPAAAQRYLNVLAELTGARLRIVSVGAQREQTFQV